MSRRSRTCVWPDIRGTGLTVRTGDRKKIDHGLVPEIWGEGDRGVEEIPSFFLGRFSVSSRLIDPLHACGRNGEGSRNVAYGNNIFLHSAAPPADCFIFIDSNAGAAWTGPKNRVADIRRKTERGQTFRIGKGLWYQSGRDVRRPCLPAAVRWSIRTIGYTKRDRTTTQ